tara:strand:+ start:236 stop:421 length:186 start_codon:yes stop_codon:yes gene_type:complete
MTKQHWMKWHMDSKPRDAIESIMEVVNDIIRENNMQIEVNYYDDVDGHFNYQANLYKKEIK